MRRLAWALIAASTISTANEGGGGAVGEGDFIKMEPFTINLSGGHVIQYVAQAKLKDAHEKDYVMSFVPLIRFELIKAMIGQDYATVQSPAYMAAFSEKASKLINTTLGGDFIKEVFFASWITQ